MKYFKGNLKDLKNNWKLKEKDVWIDYQVLGPMFAALRMYLSMEGVIPVIVGPKGCLNHLRFTIIAWGEKDFCLGKKPISLLEIPRYEIIIGNYRINEHWHAKMKKLIELENSSLIALLPADPVAISGIEMSRLAVEIQEMLEIDVTYIEKSAISGANQWEGYNAALKSLYRPFLNREYPKQDLVNLVGWMWPSRKREHEIGACIDMLKQIDINVGSIVTGGSTLEDIENSMSARANAMVCSAVAGDLFHELESKGIKLAASRSPYGFTGTEEWLTGISEALGIDNRDKINSLKDLYLDDFYQLKKVLQGKKIFVSGGPGRLIGLLHMMIDYELDIQAAGLFWPHPWSEKDIYHMLEEHNLTMKKIIISPGLDDLAEVAQEFSIDLWLGGYQEQHICKKKKIPFVPITVYTSPHVGFEGVINLGRKLKMALEGYDFTENIMKAKEIQPCIYHLKK